MRRFLLLLCTVLLCLPAAAGLSESDYATFEGYWSGDYRYALLEDDSAVITYCGSDAQEIAVPAELDGHPVRMIGRFAFDYRAMLRHLTLPEGVEIIDEYAFQSCTKLETVLLPESLRELREGAFWACFELRRINLPDALERVDEGALGYTVLDELSLSPDHPLLEAVDGSLIRRTDHCLLWSSPHKTGTYPVPEGVLRIGKGAIYASEAEVIVLPDGLTSLSESAICNCEALRELRVPKSVDRLDTVLSFCTQLTDVVIDPENPALKTVDGVVFSKDGEALVFYPLGRTEKSYTVPDGTRTILNDAFCGASLTSVQLPAGLETIGLRAFDACLNLSKINFPEGLRTISGAAFNNCALTEISLPASLEQLNGSAFVCQKLKKITVAKGSAFYAVKENALIYLPEHKLVLYPRGLNAKKVNIPKGVEQIGQAAFAGCQSLTEITIPEGVRIIQATAFSGCDNLKKVSLPKSIERIDYNAFETFSKTYSLFGNATFYIYAGTQAEAIIKDWGAPMKIRK